MSSDRWPTVCACQRLAERPLERRVEGSGGDNATKGRALETEQSRPVGELEYWMKSPPCQHHHQRPLSTCNYSKSGGDLPVATFQSGRKL